MMGRRTDLVRLWRELDYLSSWPVGITHLTLTKEDAKHLGGREVITVRAGPYGKNITSHYFSCRIMIHILITMVG